jgi:hypothetical protein
MHAEKSLGEEVAFITGAATPLNVERLVLFEDAR